MMRLRSPFLHRRSRLLLSSPRSFSSLPEKSNVVIVGGGIIGASVAYHLAKAGMKNVVLLERHQLTAGTTWHAAGLINTFGSLSSTSTYMRKYSKELYSKVLPEETGMDTGYQEIGFIELATDEDHLHYYRRVAAFNRHCGIDVQEINATSVKDKFPLLNTDDILSGFYVPSDGRVNPHEATMALARASQRLGVEIHQGVGAERILTKSSATSILPQATGVITDSGHQISCNAVVNCAGMWARQLAEQNGVIVPNQAAEHYYLITDAMPEVDPTWPVVEDSANCVYIRPEAGGLMLGLFEWEGASWNSNRVPHDFSFGEIEPDWDRMLPYLERAMEQRIPATMEVGARNSFVAPKASPQTMLPS